MGYTSTAECVADLERDGQLIRISDQVDPHLEMAEIHRRVFQNGGPALLFENVAGCRFPMASNLFGTLERARFLFRDTIENVRRAIELKIEPTELMRRPLRYLGAPLTAWRMQPRRTNRGPVLKNSIRLSELPGLTSWPLDGGPFITLPQVYSEDATRPGWQKSNLGMYRVQLAGNQYEADQQVGLHYQIHRGIGVHHQLAKTAGKPFAVNIFVGGAPAMSLAAVMPLPEGLSELTFAGALCGRRIPMIRRPGGIHIYGDADFCISGTVLADRQLPEGPFGDHLGYYSLVHDFPVLQVEHVYHRPGAIWPFTVVGRPPQEDTSFGELIHELTGPVIPSVLPGVQAVHAVDAAGVHPLLLAIGSERYTPYQQDNPPQELLTQANAILGQGQLSLAKYLWILDQACAPALDIADIEQFFIRMLERADWRRDLHFQTNTTIDTLDYSGTGINRGSKVVIAATGAPRFKLPLEIPPADAWSSLPPGFSQPKLALPGVLCLSAPAWTPPPEPAPIDWIEPAISRLLDCCGPDHPIQQYRLVAVVDDAEFCVRSFNNFLWAVFTRSNPANDIHGFDSSIQHKHWGCRGSLIIDARSKPHHAPPLVEDPEITARVDARATRGDSLARYL